MNQDRSFLDKYKVPKKKSAVNMELLSEDSEIRNDFISKIIESFRKPEISKMRMKFQKAWSINISNSITSYSKRRSTMKAKNKALVESIGFLYLNDESQLEDLVKTGKQAIGNNSESHFGNCKSGISLSQHADICHSSFPKSGIILLVKYLKGRVNYLPFETENKSDPDPNYDCHMNKEKLSIDSSTTTNLAFQSTQVLVYEYDEDIDIIDYPSQVLFIGAVQFSWNGSSLFKELYRKDNVLSNSNSNNSKITFKLKTNKRHIDAHSETVSTKRSYLSNQNSNVEPSTSSSNLFETEMLSSTLILGKSFISDSRFNLNVTLMSRLKEKIVISNILNKNWNLLELLPNKIFENYLSYKENNVEKHLHLSSSVINNLPGNINDRKKLGATFRPKYALHFTMNPVSYRDKKLMLKVIEQLKSKNTVGVVRCNTLCNILFYVFPSGPISKLTGVSSHDANCNLHVVIFTEQHPQFLPCNYTPQDKILKREQKLFQDILSDYEAMNNPKLVQKSVILIDVLRSSIATHKSKLYDKLSDKILNKFPFVSKVPIESKNNDSDMEIDSDFDTSSCYKSKYHIEGTSNSKETNNNLSNKTPIVEPSTSQQNYFSNQTLPQPHNFIASKTNSIVINPFNNPGQSLPVIPHLPNGTSISPVSSELISESPRKYKGHFKLVKLTKLRKPSPRENEIYSSRRPIYLDSGIFEMTSDYNHVSIYKGGF